MEELVLDLIVNNDPTRENALLELSKKRESFPELAVFLWHSFGTVSVLLQEIVSIYSALNPPALTASASNRVCNALALLQCVASHPETRSLFLKGGSASSRASQCAACHAIVVRDGPQSVPQQQLEHCPDLLPCPGAANVPLFLYPFLNTTSKTRPFEYLRLTSLGVIGALVKVCSSISVLLGTLKQSCGFLSLIGSSRCMPITLLMEAEGFH